MRPSYTVKYTEIMGEKCASVTATVDRPFRDIVTELADVESTSGSQLTIEGLTRVLEDRFEDPEFIARIAADPESHPLITAQLQARGILPQD